MPTLLHIESSPRKTRSASLDVARAYLEAWRDAHPDHTIDVLDPFSSDIVVPSTVGSGDGRSPGGGFDQPLEENPR